MPDAVTRMRVVADDDEATRRVLRRLLEHAGFEVVTAPDGLAALTAAVHEPVAAAIIDLRMPGWDGIETLQRLRAEFPTLPVVLLSGHGDIPTAVDAMRRGADDFLPKPVTMGTLLSALTRALRRRATVRAAGTGDERPVDRRVAEALRHVAENPAAARRALSRAAGRLQLSPAHLNRLIERETGRPFSAHQRSARMALAAALLRDTNLSIKEIAAQTGYGHASSFDRWFRRAFAVTPGEYRMSRQDGGAAPGLPPLAEPAGDEERSHERSASVAPPDDSAMARATAETPALGLMPPGAPELAARPGVNASSEPAAGGDGQPGCEDLNV